MLIFATSRKMKEKLTSPLLGTVSTQTEIDSERNPLGFINISVYIIQQPMAWAPQRFASAPRREYWCIIEFLW